MNIDQLKQLLVKSWDLETCSPGLKEKWTSINPSLGQCAITALIVNDLFGGKIMRCMASSGSHYYNMIDDELIDLTVDQFLGEIPDYSNGEERTREYLLSNEDTKKRYLLLNKNLNKTIEKEIYPKSCSTCSNGSCRIENFEKVGLDEHGNPQGSNCIGWENKILELKRKI